MTSHQPLPVILIHGLHMHAWAMQPLAKRLRQQGFAPYCFGYYSVWQDLASHSQRLNAWLAQRFSEDTPLYLIGHSLGGLVIRDFVARYPQWQVKRCVTIGTPHNGSLSADRVIKLVPSFIGRSYHQGLDGQVPPLPAEIALGSIAGTLSAGLGRLILPNTPRDANNLLAYQNDGTVYVHETQPTQAHCHLCVPSSHTGMLLNPQVAQQVAYFLKHGEFQPTS